MTTLRQWDGSGVRSRVVDLAVTMLDSIGDPGAFPAHAVLELLSEELDAAGAVLQRVDWVSGESEIVLHRYPQSWVPRLRQATRALRQQHPLLSAAAAGQLAPATAQDAAGGRAAWHRSPSRAFLSQLVACPQIVSVGLRGDPREVKGLAFARSGRDFTAGDLRALAEVQPVLQALDRHLNRLQTWRASLPRGQEVQAAITDTRLTGREVEVLLLLAQDLTAAAAARRLGCSPRTVQKHTANLFLKLEVHDRLGAVLEAQRRGLLPAPRVERRSARSRDRGRR